MIQNALLSSSDLEREELAAELRGSFLEFTKTFYPIVTTRHLIVSQPVSRESHHITMARALTRAFRLECKNHRLIINVPPGHSKSLFLCCWVAWALASYPDSNFLYIAYSKSLAKKHTDFIRRLMTTPKYELLFEVRLRSDSKAKDLFKTTEGGTVAAFGMDGAITGEDAGLPGLDRFSGAILIDDAHKPKEVHSQVIREGVINNYNETVKQRKRSEKVPIIFIGQRLREEDLAHILIRGDDGYEWEKVILKSIDEAGNTLFPETFPKEMLFKEQKVNPYVFSAQYQQAPKPPGGGLFKKDWFVYLEEEPEFLTTFITGDTAETNKSWNDATVFSFWGLYEIEEGGQPTGSYGLHWLSCVELRVEPSELKSSFMDFYSNCMRHPTPPSMVSIEKKSTGVTLLSTIENLRGVEVRKIERTVKSGSKVNRFLSIQSFVASKCVSFSTNALHANMCITHMSKITANDTHTHDDIADTCADAINIALIEKTLHYANEYKESQQKVVSKLQSSFLKRQEALRSGHVRR